MMRIFFFNVQVHRVMNDLLCIPEAITSGSALLLRYLVDLAESAPRCFASDHNHVLRRMVRPRRRMGLVMAQVYGGGRIITRVVRSPSLEIFSKSRNNRSQIREVEY